MSVECHYFEKGDKTKDTSTEWIAKLHLPSKNALFILFVNIKQSGSKYILSDEDYRDVLRYIEHSGLSHLENTNFS